MLYITINGNKTISCNSGDNLYNVLTENGFLFTGSCGGNNRCSRCMVYNENTGSFIKSCQYIVMENLSVRIEDDTMLGITAHYCQEKKPDAMSGITAHYCQGEEADGQMEYGIAVDIGTTTIAMELVDICTGEIIDSFHCINPQCRVGADVVSRIKAASSTEGLNHMRQLVISEIKRGMDSLTKDIPDKKKQRMKLVCAGNTTMLSIVEGFTTENLGAAPFTIKNRDAFVVDLEDVHKAESRAGIKLTCLPNISAYVGADISAGACALKLDRDSNYRMLIDLGTNGEMILCNNQGGVAAATACGPAFEGSFRQKGIHGANIIDMIALLRRRNCISKDGVLSEPYFDTGFQADNKITIDMELIRNIQLAKSAIKSGIQVLTGELGISLTDIKEVYVSGGFGFHLNVTNAIFIGLFPVEFEHKITISGNSALYGAYKALLEPEFIDTMYRFHERIKSINLGDLDAFSALFIENLSLTS